jgi:hypothetical protein
MTDHEKNFRKCSAVNVCENTVLWSKCWLVRDAKLRVYHIDVYPEGRDIKNLPRELLTMKHGEENRASERKS